METYEAIYSRKSVRDFNQNKINYDKIKKILDAGIRAPSNNHLRQWHFIIINDEGLRLKLVKKIKKKFSNDEVSAILDKWGCFDECQRKMYFDGIPKQYKMILSAPCLIIPCFYQPYSLLKVKEISGLNFFASMWCCIENILIAASSEGIYGVTRIPFKKESTYIKEILNMPSDYEVPCYLALGYPADDAPEIKQLEVKIEEKIHYNKW